MANYNIVENIQLCADIVRDASQLLYYSHIPTALVALVIGFFILYKNKANLLSKLLFSITLLFAIWTFLDLLVWFDYGNSSSLMFFWSLFGIVYILLYVFTLYFVVVFIQKTDVPFGSKLITCLLISPIVILLPTIQNLSGYSAADCIALETTWYTNYYLFGGLFVALFIILFALYKWKSIEKNSRKLTLLLLIGIESFLLFFFITVWGIGYLIDNGYIPYGNYNLEQYGLFSMPIFMAFLGYLIVKFDVFNTKLVASQALIFALLFIIGAEFFFVETIVAQVLVAITLIIAMIGGYYLVKSVKKEIAQREQIEGLVLDLNKANERLKELDKMKSEFVSIASHQLRSPLTSIRGYASMLAEGSYGKLPEKAGEILTKIAESSNYMARSIEDYLNVSRIEAGNMKYEMSNFNLIEVTARLVEELQPVAMKKGLVLTHHSECTGTGLINADIGKTRQIIMNLIDNSMKYTPEGTITVTTHDDLAIKKIYISIQDTGVGMSKETIGAVFDKFVRAKNANQVNVTGTGLGLYVAKKMATEMKGRVWAESEGEGEGSTFHIEFPMK